MLNREFDELEALLKEANDTRQQQLLEKGILYNFDFIEEEAKQQRRFVWLPDESNVPNADEAKLDVRIDGVNRA